MKMRIIQNLIRHLNKNIVVTKHFFKIMELQAKYQLPVNSSNNLFVVILTSMLKINRIFLI